MRRAGVAVILGLLAATPFAAAQEERPPEAASPPARPVQTLDALQRAFDRASHRFARASAAVDRLEGAIGSLRARHRQLDTLYARLKEQVKEGGGGILASQALEQTRQELDRLSRQLSQLYVRLEAAERDRAAARVVLLQAAPLYAHRLLEVAARNKDVDRAAQAQAQVAEALEVLDLVADLEAVQYQIGAAPDLAVELDGRSEELHDQAELFRYLAQDARLQAEQLAPVEAMYAERVERLKRVQARGYQLERLQRALPREQERLTYVRSLRAQAVARGEEFSAQIARIEGELARRGYRPK